MANNNRRDIGYNMNREQELREKYGITPRQDSMSSDIDAPAPSTSRRTATQPSQRQNVRLLSYQPWNITTTGRQGADNYVSEASRVVPYTDQQIVRQRAYNQHSISTGQRQIWTKESPSDTEPKVVFGYRSPDSSVVEHLHGRQGADNHGSEASRAAPYTDQQIARRRIFNQPIISTDQQQIRKKESPPDTEPKVVSGNAVPRANRKRIKGNENPGLYDHLITELGLKSYFPRQITLSDVQERSSRCLKEAQDIPWVLLNRLLMADGTARDTCCEVLNQSGDCYPDDELAMLTQKLQGLPIDETNGQSLHPMDVLQATLACCNLLLLQSVFHKMFMCRLAIPMMSLRNDYNIEFMLWSSYEILLECSQNVETRAVKAPLPVVSFVRIGQLNQSKSILLNAMLKSTCHTFFNRESPCGLVKRSMSGGLLEVSWLLPKDISKVEPILFMNLRGDSPSLPKFNEIISIFSQVVVVITSSGNLTEPYNFDSLKKLISAKLKVIVVLLLNGESRDAMRSKALNALLTMNVKCVLGFDTNKFQPITMIELQKKLYEAIRAGLHHNEMTQLSSLESLAHEAHTTKILVIDDEDEQNRNAVRQIKPFFQSIAEKSSSEIKSLLVLQGGTWAKWGHLTKQQFKTHAKSCDMLSGDDLKEIKKDEKTCRARNLTKIKSYVLSGPRLPQICPEQS